MSSPSVAENAALALRELDQCQSVLADTHDWSAATPCDEWDVDALARHVAAVAWQQAEAGDDAGTRAASWQPADLLFFSDRPDKRITHVGISLGDLRMVHLALGRGGYAVERLDATDDAYVAALMARFVLARRIRL